MPKITLILISLLISFQSWGQTFSEDSEMRIVYADQAKDTNSGQKPAIFINGQFIKNESFYRTIDANQIDSISVQKVEFEKDGYIYNGKILITTKSDYTPNLITLTAFSKKHITLDGNPVIYQIDEDFIHDNPDECIIDENHILKVVVDKIKTTDTGIDINVVQLITRSPKNITKANQVRIKGK